MCLLDGVASSKQLHWFEQTYFITYDLHQNAVSIETVYCNLAFQMDRLPSPHFQSLYTMLFSSARLKEQPLPGSARTEWNYPVIEVSNEMYYFLSLEAYRVV